MFATLYFFLAFYGHKGLNMYCLATQENLKHYAKIFCHLPWHDGAGRAFPLFGLVSPSYGKGSPVVTQRQMIKIVGLSWR